MKETYEARFPRRSPCPTVHIPKPTRPVPSKCKRRLGTIVRINKMK